jgi:excinuclease ABC subunit C
MCSACAIAGPICRCTLPTKPKCRSRHRVHPAVFVLKSGNVWDARFQLARDFLDGAHDAPIETLRSAMESSSEALEFERAAQLRDKIGRLESLREQFSQLRFAVESLSFVYTVPGFGDEHRSYVIRRGRVRAELPTPASSSEKRALAVRAAEIFAPSERVSATVPAHEVDELLLLSSWFRKFPAELERTAPAANFPRARSA